MSKLDWSRAGLRATDPGRVVDVGDYGILSDRLAGRKGNPRPANKKKKHSEPKVQTAPAKPSQPSKKAVKKRSAHKGKPQNGQLRGGLTIPEMVARSRGMVDRISAEIIKTERRLATLREQLKSAERQLQDAKDTPRRSAIGQALHKAERGNNAPHPKV